MILRYRDDFTTYLLLGPEVVESAMHGPCLRALYRIETGWPHAPWKGPGDFRLDRCTLIEPAGGQLDLEKAA